jgi:hypothetical protein
MAGCRAGDLEADRRSQQQLENRRGVGHDHRASARSGGPPPDASATVVDHARADARDFVPWRVLENLTSSRRKKSDIVMPSMAARVSGAVELHGTLRT